MEIIKELPEVKYKDKLFRYIFGQNKEWLLSLYNAVNGTDYQNPDDIKITTLEDVIYIKMKNDISLLLDSELSLYEHQSTFNPNMPLRGLFYFSTLYKSYLSEIGKDLYGKTLVRIPAPKYVVFYNGDDAVQDVVKLKLSDAFEKTAESDDFEWTATMYNINLGHNRKMMEQCLALRDYARYVEKVKTKIKGGKELEKAVKEAVDEAIKENLLNGFFKIHEKGVLDMTLTEFNEAEFVANRRAEGRAEGILITLVDLVGKGLLAVKDAAEQAGMTVEEFQQKLNA